VIFLTLSLLFPLFFPKLLRSPSYDDELFFSLGVDLFNSADFPEFFPLYIPPIFPYSPVPPSNAVSFPLSKTISSDGRTLFIYDNLSSPFSRLYNRSLSLFFLLAMERYLLPECWRMKFLGTPNSFPLGVCPMLFFLPSPQSRGISPGIDATFPPFFFQVFLLFFA